jgi:lantibiotic biosynthesis protein
VNVHAKVGGLATVRDAGEAVLRTYVARGGTGRTAFEDPGPLLVAAMLTDAAPAADPTPVPEALAAWLNRCQGGSDVHLGVCGGGMAGFVLGLERAAATWPELAAAAARARARLVALAAGSPWRRDAVGWADYDLIGGPSGTLATLAANPLGTAADCAPLVEHLVWLCAGTDDGTDLPRLRVGQYREEVLRGFNFGRINAGIGHGVPGVAVALRAAADAGALPAAGYEALQRVCYWLVRQSHVDSRAVLTWTSVGSDGGAGGAAGAGGAHGAHGAGGAAHAGHASRRQAWCYGTPGIAWTLWEAARVLDDAALTAFAVEAARSFVNAYDDDYYLDPGYPDRVGICHGAAGLLLIFDAFDRHARLPGAAGLRDHLVRYCTDRLDELLDGADTETDLSLLAGASGVVATLLNQHGDDDRRWLSGFGLR